MENLIVDVLEDILFRLSVEVALQAKRVCTTWEAILGSKFTGHDYMMAKTLQTNGGSIQFDARHCDSKMSEILQAEAGQDFFISYSYDDLYESFDVIGLQENLWRGIYMHTVLGSPRLFNKEELFPSSRSLMQSNLHKMEESCMSKNYRVCQLKNPKAVL